MRRGSLIPMIWLCLLAGSAAAEDPPSLRPAGPGSSTAGERKVRTDWPTYRHDLQLSGHSPGRGRMRTTPVEKWRWSLGGERSLLDVRFEENAGGVVTLRAETFGEPEFHATLPRWQSPPRVDLAGDGRLVPRPPGKLARLIPDLPGLQQVLWELDPDRPNTGRGRCFAFDQGVDHPRLVWETELEPETYELLWAIGDVDGDGALDVVFLTHYRAIVYDGQTGRKKSTIAWEIGRNYGQMDLVDLDGDGAREIVVAVDSPPHVDALQYAPETGRVLWSKRYITDAEVLLPIDIKLYTLPGGVGDLDGDGTIDLACNLHNASGDQLWHVVIRDALTGRVTHDLPGLFAYGVSDLGGGVRGLCCLRAEGRHVPGVAEGLLLEFREGGWRPTWKGSRVRWQMTAHDWPVEQFSVASLGPCPHQVPLAADLEGDGRPEIFAVVDNSVLVALGRNADGDVVEKARLTAPVDAPVSVLGFDAARRSLLVDVDGVTGEVSGRNCTLEILAHFPRNDSAPLPARPLALVADLDGDGRNEILAQDTHWRTRVVQLASDQAAPRELLRVPGGGQWLGTRWPGYPYAKFPVATADLEGKGTRSLLLTDVSDETVSTLTCRDERGAIRWRTALPGTPARGIVWVVPGRFVERDRVDLFVVVQNGGLGEGFALRGDDGTLLWRRSELKLANGSPFHLGSQNPMLAPADADGDGLDDILGETDPYLLVLRGRDGTPLTPPRMMIGDLFPGFVVYGEAMTGDWDGTGKPSIFTNTPLGGFGLIGSDLRVKWAIHRDGAARNCIGSVGKFAEEGPWIYGTILNGEFQAYDLRDGRVVAKGEIGVDPGAYQALYSADIDGDGQTEFLAIAGDRLISVGLNSAGQPVLEWSLTLPGASGPLAFADVDHDEALDILYTGSDGAVHILVAP